MTKKINIDGKEHEITTVEDVMEKLDENHIWLNAFSCVNPTDELAKDIGHAVLHMLNNPDCVIPNVVDEEQLKAYDPKTQKIYVDLGKLTPQLFLRINKS